jgi:hypothetical protein
MATETDPKQAPTDPKTEPTDPRESAAFKAITKQIAERDKQIADMQIRLDTVDTEAKKREQADLESRGEYEKARDLQTAEIAKLKADGEAAKAAHETEIVRSNFRLAATAAGMNNALAIDGALSAYLVAENRGDAKDWLAKLKGEDGNAGLFGTPPPGGIPAADPGAGAGSGGVNWVGVYADRDGTDIKKAEEALKKIKAYFAEHGTAPPKT